MNTTTRYFIFLLFMGIVVYTEAMIQFIDAQSAKKRIFAAVAVGCEDYVGTYLYNGGNVDAHNKKGFSEVELSILSKLLYIIITLL